MSRRKVLVADDNKSFVEAVRRRLVHAGYDVVVAYDSYNSLAKAHSERPDLMLLDINMPAGDGFTVMERLHSSWEGSDRPPVIYMTGDQSVQHNHLSPDPAAFTILHKPVRLTVLFEAIESALGIS